MKRFIVFLFLFVFLFSLVSSASIEIKENYNLGETVIGEIKGTFLENIVEEDFRFYRRHLDTAMEGLIIEKIEGRILFYFQIPIEKVADNYSIVISDVLHMNGQEQTSEDIFVNFSISGEISEFSISPGFVHANNSFFIEFVNLRESEILIKVDAEEIIYDGSQPEENSGGFFDFLFGENDNETSNEAINETVLPETIYVSSEEVLLNEGEIKEIEFNPNTKGFSEIIFSSGNQVYHIPVYFEGILEIDEEVNNAEVNETLANESEIFEDNETIVNETDYVEEENLSIETCDEKGGEICLKNVEECQGEEETARRSTCCIGECIEKEQSSVGKTIGWILIVAVAFFLVWFFKSKYRKSRKEIDLEEVAKGKKKR